MKPIHAIILLIISSLNSFAEKTPSSLKLGAPFNHNAVLQRDMPVPIWGWATPNTEITLTFAGQTKTTTTKNNHKWSLNLAPLEASFEPRQLRVTTSNNQTLTLKNILVGEVWLASGQSNMQWIAQKSTSRKLKTDPVNNIHPIREFSITDYFACLHPIEHASGNWKNGNYGQYSAVAYAFAHKLYHELKVPIGILNCSFSQTSIQAWTPRQGFANHPSPYIQNIHQQILETDPSTPEHKKAWNHFYQSIENTLKENNQLVADGKTAKPIPNNIPGNLQGNRDSSWLFNARLNPVIPFALRGAIWNQGYANIGGGTNYYHHLHCLIKGWRTCWNRPNLPVYFHQFYSPGPKGGWKNSHPSIAAPYGMRAGTTMARDIPHTGMASQIDIEGSIHYRNKAVPGQRLALHALKNQYSKNIIANGPIFKSYTVKGNQLTIEFDHTADGLVVAENKSNAQGRNENATGFADPTIIPNGIDQVTHFYLADQNRVWHPAKATIEGHTIILKADNVPHPKGVSYGTSGIGFRPSLYNTALLPMTPFIYFDQKRVTKETWPDEKLEVANVTIDPKSVGIVYEYRKMPLLSTQFRDNAILQADQPVTIWGSAVHNWGFEAKGKAQIEFTFGDIKKSIPVTKGMREWQVTLPAMPAGTKPYQLDVKFFIDNKLVHQRTANNIIFGDVWFVAAPHGHSIPKIPTKSSAPVRMIARKAMRSSHPSPSRFSVAVSTTPNNRFASVWAEAKGLAASIGHQLGAQTGRPTGIVFMPSAGQKGQKNPLLKEWIPRTYFKNLPSLKDDYIQLATAKPGNKYYNKNVQEYLQSWKTYWSEYIPKMISTKAVPDQAPWGGFPNLTANINTNAGNTYNVMVHSFGPGNFKGIVFLTAPEVFAEDKGQHFGEQFSILANSWKQHFNRNSDTDPAFIYTIPSKELAPKISPPNGIHGRSYPVKINDWKSLGDLMKTITFASKR